MSSKRQKIETEITKYRNESKWAKVEESMNYLIKKYGNSDGAAMMLDAEVKLELYLQDNPPRSSNVSKAKKDLMHLKSKLQDSMSSDCKESMFLVKEESCMLLCKLLYAQGNTFACLNMMKNLDLKKIGREAPVPCYRLRLIAETYACKGLSLEHSSQLNVNDGENEPIIDCYELSTEYSLSYVAQCEKWQNSGSSLEELMTYGMEIAFQRGPLLHIKNKNIVLAIQRLRNSLKSLESKVTTVQQTLARDLATIFLRGISEINYEPSTTFQNGDGHMSENVVSGIPRKHGTGGSSSPSVTYTLGSPLDHTFSPYDCTQESILLLLITEAMINTDPILDMSPDYYEARDELLHDSRRLYDLLAVALSRYYQYDVFSKSIEASLKYAYDEFHLWYQYGLSILSSGKYDRAFRVFMECCRIRPKHPASYLLIAKICIQNLGEKSKGIEYAEKALELASMTSEDESMENSELEENSEYLAAAHITVGLACCLQCVDGTPKKNVDDFRSRAMTHFEKAHKIDPLDYKPLLFIAIEMGLERRINDAVTKVKQSLELQPNDLNCLHLLVLLRTSQKQVKEPLNILHTACKMYPENISLLITKCKLEMYIGDNEEALCTCFKIMQIWKDLHESYTNNMLNVDNMMERMTSDGLSVTNQSTGNELDIDAGSFIANSAVLSRVGRALSGIESSLGDLQARTAGVVVGHPMILQAQIWLLTSEVYTSLKRYEEASQCIKEASTLFPLSYEVLYMLGKLAQCRGEFVEAETMFSNTLAINPKHYKALWSWGQILMQRDQPEFAKKLLQDAVKLSPMSYEIWQTLGEVFQQTNDMDEAVDCMSTAINLEATSPVLPFTIISRDI